MQTTNSKRRNFLVTFGFGGIGAAAALMSGKQLDVTKAESIKTETKPPRNGYRLSEHIKTYYHKARI
jgi:hypothetical protein